MIECGEIYYIKNDKKINSKNTSEIWAGRPGIVISSEENIRENSVVSVIYVTSSEKDKGLSVFLSDQGFAFKRNQYPAHQALCSQVHTVDKSRLGSYYGKVTDNELKQIKDMVINRALF